LLATLWPFHLDPDLGRAAERMARAFRPELRGGDVIDGARNLVLFGGWGLVWAVTGRGGLPRLLLNATLTGGLVSLTVEAMQCFARDRFASILDLTSNTLGAFAGALTLVLLALAVRSRKDARSYLGLPMMTFAGAYGLACALEAFVPLFRQSTVPGAWGGPLQRLAVTWRALDARASLLDPPLGNALLMAPAGALFVAALAELGLGSGWAVVLATLAGALTASLAEIGHGMLGMPLDLGALATNAVAASVGAVAMAAALPALTRRHRGAARVRAFLAAYAGLMLLWSLRPYLPELSPATWAAKLARPWWIPLASLGMRRDFFSVVDVCAPFFRFLPLGALLAVWPMARTGPWRGPLPAIWLAAATEFAQVFVAGRMLDITDMLVPAAGAAVGWAILRRAGYPERGVLSAPVPAGRAE
jgi:glycopeptide antibiotics resistance protein